MINKKITAIVTPSSRYTNGSAVHVVLDRADVTACGKPCVNWQWLSGPIDYGKPVGLNDVSCKICNRIVLSGAITPCTP